MFSVPMMAANKERRFPNRRTTAAARSAHEILGTRWLPPSDHSGRHRAFHSLIKCSLSRGAFGWAICRFDKLKAPSQSRGKSPLLGHTLTITPTVTSAAGTRIVPWFNSPDIYDSSACKTHGSWPFYFDGAVLGRVRNGRALKRLPRYHTHRTSCSFSGSVLNFDSIFSRRPS